MGQRLVINIKRDEEIIANGYYHWSAYTGSALELGKQILVELAASKEKFDSDIALAYHLLKHTGAKLNQEEELNLRKDPSLYPEIRDYFFSECESYKELVDRTEGLISVTPKGIASSEEWAEGDVSIDLDDDTMLFSVLGFEEDQEYIMEEYDMEESDIAEVPQVVFPFPDVFTLENVHVLEEAIELAEKNEFGFFRSGEDDFYQLVQ